MLIFLDPVRDARYNEIEMQYRSLNQLVKKWPELQDAGYKRISDVQGSYQTVTTSVNWRGYPIENNTIMWDKQQEIAVEINTTMVVFDAFSKKGFGSNIFGSNIFGKEELALMVTFPNKGAQLYAMFLFGDQFSDYLSPHVD